MKTQLNLFFVAFLFLVSCTSNSVKIQRPELDNKKNNGHFVKSGSDKKGFDSKSNSAKSNISGAKLTARNDDLPAQSQQALSPLLLEESKFLQLEKNSQFFEALKISSNLSVNYTDPVKMEFYKQKSIAIVTDKLTLEELHQVSRSSDFGYLRAHALFKLGTSYLAAEPDESKRFFTSVIEIAPEGDLANRSKSLLEDMAAAKRVSPQTIGLVVPLTGKSASLGQKVLRGVQLGLGTNQAFSKFKIAVIDSEGRTDIARKGIERLIKEDNVIAIIGGVLAKTVSTELITANEYKVPFIYLSQKQGLGELHSQALRNALTAEMQVRQLVRNMMVEKDLKDFAILYPNDAYGVEYANAFWDEVLAQGGRIVGVQSYDPKATDFRPMVQRLVGTFYIEARKEEFTQKLKLFKQSLKNKSSRENINADDILPPIQDFDAIFIPDQAKTIAQISAFLSYAGVKETSLLTTNLMNTPGSNKKLAGINFPIYFVDSFISDGPHQFSTEFANTYMTVFNERPTQFEIAAYDSGLILRQILLKGAESREEVGNALIQLKNFSGSYGPLNATTFKEILRPLLTLTFDKGEINTYKN
ncbi:MAG: penicillin-binding protein activator [Bdellovibrionaceae bacterium]|nr:penicillin-binding protein activator [Pseudobdellovibrionaceae bacterium]